MLTIPDAISMDALSNLWIQKALEQIAIENSQDQQQDDEE